MPGFIPDALVIRDGAVVPLLRALQAFLTWADASGSQGDIVDEARAAVAMAIDPCIDVGDWQPDELTLADIREAGEAGAKACAGRRARASNPHNEGHPLHLHWDRGWELENIRIKEAPPCRRWSTP